MSSTFRCYLIGETSLPVSCAEMLLQEGHDVRGVISADADVVRWAKERGVPRFEPGDDLPALLAAEPFDYLFSVNNLRLLEPAVVAAPSRGAINFHDGPLPAYAGLNTPVWAILRGETSYGISWHTIADGIDDGVVLEREPVEIRSDDTALTLNTKCYEAAIRSFTRLVAALGEGEPEGEVQDLSGRIYFGKDKRPDAACTLRWDRPADELSALVRALEFGDYANPLGLPKLLRGHEAPVVSALAPTGERSGAEPGTVLAVDDGAITVATATDDVRVTVAGSYAEGERLPLLSDAEASALTAFHEGLARDEDFWAGRLAALDPLVLPYARPATGTSEPRVRELGLPHGHDADAVVGALLMYAARLAGTEEFDVGYRDDALLAAIAGREPLAAAAVPLHVTISLERGFAANLPALRDELATVRGRVSYMRDLAERDARLAAAPSVAVEVTDRLDDAALPPGAGLAIVVASDGSRCRWVYDADALDEQSAGTMERQFATFLDALSRDGERPLFELDLLGDDELSLLLRDWNDTAEPYGRHLCVHGLFEQQVERTPDAVALVAGTEELTYRELDRRANRLARHLQALGVRPDTRVGVYVPRSAEMVIGLMAILKAGGAYVPMDPAYPARRIAFMIEDAEVPVLLSSAEVAGDLPDHDAHVVLVDEEPDCSDGPARLGRGVREPRVRDLHLRLDRQAEGRDGQAPQRRQLLLRHGRADRVRASRASGSP